MNRQQKEKKKETMLALSGWRYAHRGLHTKGEAPENSREAFRRAVEAGYGAELDVHLLSDGTLAVFHDDTLERMTGRTGNIGDCTAEDLPELFLSGTQETIPRLQDILQIFNGRAPLIIELKTQGRHASALTEAVCRVLDTYQGLFCIESFDPIVLSWLKRNRPEIVRGILSQDFIKNRSGLSPLKAFAATHLLHSVLTRPDFIAYRFKDRRKFGNRFGLKVMKRQGVTWTIRKPAQLTEAEAEGLWPIFENFRP